MNELELINSGWEKRNVVEEPRLTELVTLYEELGFKVSIIDYTMDNCSDDSSDACNECMIGSQGKYKVIFTKQDSD